MKRWAFFTVLIYVAALLLLTFPVVYVAFAGKGFTIQQAADTYFYWGLLALARRARRRANSFAVGAH
jgi:hypothetical protein